MEQRHRWLCYFRMLTKIDSEQRCKLERTGQQPKPLLPESLKF